MQKKYMFQILLSHIFGCSILCTCLLWILGQPLVSAAFAAVASMVFVVGLGFYFYEIKPQPQKSGRILTKKERKLSWRIPSICCLRIVGCLILASIFIGLGLLFWQSLATYDNTAKTFHPFFIKDAGAKAMFIFVSIWSLTMCAAFSIDRADKKWQLSKETKHQCCCN